MAIGASLYFVGIATTVLVLFVQIFLHKNFRWLHLPTSEQINIEFCEDAGAITYVQDKFAENHIEILSLKAEKSGNGFLEVELNIKLPNKYDISRLMNVFKDNPYIRSIEY